MFKDPFKKSDDKGFISCYTPLILDGIGECNMIVYKEEDVNPHFHIESKDGKFETCICIYECKYFKHDYNIQFLNQIQLEQLQKYLYDFNGREVNPIIGASLSWYYKNGDNYSKDMNLSNIDYTKLSPKSICYYYQ